MVWNELSAEREIGLIPVEGIEPERLTSELVDVRAGYTSESPHVFLHVTMTESDRNDIVVWAVRRRTDWALVHAVSSTTVAETIVNIACCLPVRSIHFIWSPTRLSLVKHYLFRFLGRESSIPLDVKRLLRRRSGGGMRPEVLIRLTR